MRCTPSAGDVSLMPSARPHWPPPMTRMSRGPLTTQENLVHAKLSPRTNSDIASHVGCFARTSRTKRLVGPEGPRNEMRYADAQTIANDCIAIAEIGATRNAAPATHFLLKFLGAPGLSLFLLIPLSTSKHSKRGKQQSTIVGLLFPPALLFLHAALAIKTS